MSILVVGFLKVLEYDGVVDNGIPSCFFRIFFSKLLASRIEPIKDGI